MSLYLLHSNCVHMVVVTVAQMKLVVVVEVGMVMV